MASIDFINFKKKENPMTKIIPLLNEDGIEKMKVAGQLASEVLQMLDPHICLLYTSPSPRDRTRSRMPSSA